jgi:hypothetical protein
MGMSMMYCKKNEYPSGRIVENCVSADPCLDNLEVFVWPKNDLQNLIKLQQNCIHWGISTLRSQCPSLSSANSFIGTSGAIHSARTVSDTADGPSPSSNSYHEASLASNSARTASGSADNSSAPSIS